MGAGEDIQLAEGTLSHRGGPQGGKMQLVLDLLPVATGTMKIHLGVSAPRSVVPDGTGGQTGTPMGGDPMP